MVMSIFANNRIVSVVDDDSDTSLLFYDALSSINGLCVCKFTDPIMALEHLKLYSNDYVIAISDLRMPVINGAQMLKTVRDLNPHTRTILMTAFEMDDRLLQEYVKNKIINRFLQKPIGLDGLVNEVDRQLHYFEMQKIIPS